jgi:hypothetical protein
VLQTGNANEQKFPGDLQQLIEATAPAIRATNETEYQQTYDFSVAYPHLPNKMYFCPLKIVHMEEYIDSRQLIIF